MSAHNRTYLKAHVECAADNDRLENYTQGNNCNFSFPHRDFSGQGHCAQQVLHRKNVVRYVNQSLAVELNRHEDKRTEHRQLKIVRFQQYLVRRRCTYEHHTVHHLQDHNCIRHQTVVALSCHNYKYHHTDQDPKRCRSQRRHPVESQFCLQSLLVVVSVSLVEFVQGNYTLSSI